MKNITAIALLLFFSFTGCKEKKKDYEKIFEDGFLYSKTLHELTEVITHDIFAPPPASRIYAYSNLAAYEVVAAGLKNYQSLQRQLKGFDSIPNIPNGKINVPLAALVAFMNVGHELTFSKDSTQKIIDALRDLAIEHGMPDDVLQRSMTYAKSVSDRVMKWSKSDMYAQTRSVAKYTVNNDDGKWIPTPPGYIQAAEPAWMLIRPLALDSAGLFMPNPPPAYSKDSTSAFRKMVENVYAIGKNLTDEQKACADFWDCNGYKLHSEGHMMYATKAMTPGGHWMGITGAICQNQKADFAKTVYTYTAVSFGIFDGFIACWNSKYYWSLLRPETYINKYMDVSWQPYLQTPPFPEYISGHSVISSAAATVLTRIYGDNVPFKDSTERAWGHPDRIFKNAEAAAQEASVSRLYGGIHYRESLDAGLVEGANVGNYVFHKLRMSKDD